MSEYQLQYIEVKEDTINDGQECIYGNRYKNVYEQIVDFAKEFQAEKDVLFGSRAKGTNNEKSDIDIAVYGCNNFEKLIQNEYYYVDKTLLIQDIIKLRQLKWLRKEC